MGTHRYARALLPGIILFCSFPLFLILNSMVSEVPEEPGPVQRFESLEALENELLNTNGIECVKLDGLDIICYASYHSNDKYIQLSWVEVDGTDGYILKKQTEKWKASDGEGNDIALYGTFRFDNIANIDFIFSPEPIPDVDGYREVIFSGAYFYYVQTTKPVGGEKNVSHGPSFSF